MEEVSSATRAVLTFFWTLMLAMWGAGFLLYYRTRKVAHRDDRSFVDLSVFQRDLIALRSPVPAVGSLVFFLINSVYAVFVKLWIPRLFCLWSF